MKTILLIEDNADMRDNTSEILELANYKVVAAENGKKGVELAQKKNPDLIICDVMMPELDGYGVLHILSKDTATAQIPFIFLTAKAEKSDFRKGMNLGADDYITKPFSDIELLDAIEMRLRKNALLKTEFNNDLEGINDFFAKAKEVSELIQLSNEQETKLYKKKENIYSIGQMPKGLYFIVKGKVKIFKTNEDGKEYITDFYTDGDFIGYSSLLENKPFNESAAAIEDTEICIIPKQDFLSLIYSNREVSSKFIQLLTHNLKEKEERLLKLAYDSVRMRVAEALIMLRNKFMNETNKNQEITINREDLANIVGTAKESLIRTLSDFKDENLIDIKTTNIIILQPEKLANLKY